MNFPVYLPCFSADIQSAERDNVLSQIRNRRAVMIAAMNTISGDRVPVIICDECHEVIEDVAMAMAATPASEGPPGEIQQVLHIHKTNCHEALEEREGKCLPWLELQDYLASLADVVKFTS